MDAPAVAVSADGKHLAASWMDFQLGPGKPDVWWSLGSIENEPLSRVTRGDQRHPALVCDAQGRFWAAWDDSRSGEPEIWIARLAQGAASRRLSDPLLDGPATFPSLASGGGLLAVVYETSAEEVVLRVVTDER